MYQWSSPIARFACLCLLAAQVSGLHLHIELDPHGSQPDHGSSRHRQVHDHHAPAHGSHVHEADQDGHDHSADIDVSLLKLGTIWSKLILSLLGAAALIWALVWVLHTLKAPISHPFCGHQTAHLRPPLRAPPQLLLTPSS